MVGSFNHETALSSSAVMTEKDAFVAGLGLLQDSLAGVGITSITTDANIQIRNYMKSVGGIKHGLDVWHVNKNLQKNLQKKASKKVRRKIQSTRIM